MQAELQAQMQPLPAETFPFQPSGLMIPGCPGFSERTTVASYSRHLRSCLGWDLLYQPATSAVNQLVDLTRDVAGPAIHLHLLQP